MRMIEWMRHNKLVMLLTACVAALLIATIALAHKNVQLLQSQTEDFQLRTEGDVNSLPAESHSRIKSYRLPKYIRPLNYKLLLRPNMNDKTYNGTVTIALDLLQPTKQIILHSNLLSIDGLTLKNEKYEELRVKRDIIDDKREFLYINSVDNIPEGRYYSLEINFSGRLDRGIVGFYSKNLKDGGTMVASKFEPTYARQAFPCFDEPEYKATFDISLVKPTTHIALSNMNEISKTLDNNTDLETVTFATSPPMSTYLTSFVVCDYDFKEIIINANNIGQDFILRIFAQKDQMHKIDLALDIGKKYAEYFIKYFEVPYPLPKLDMIAIPDYHASGTYHWGLVTYRDTSLLVDRATASTANKMTVANTIAHEFVHMWLGNLVTMKWWNDLWLNEGFPSFLQVKVLHAIDPKRSMLDLFLTKVLHPVLVTDAKLSSHPIVHHVETPAQIKALFDQISFKKGACVLRMLEGFIGEENFRKGLSNYIRNHEYGNTVTKDLFNALEPYFRNTNTDFNLTHIMDTWTRQTGYPLLNVTKGDKPNSYVITQSRYLLDPITTYPRDSPFNYRWFVPITYTTNKGANGKVVWFPDTADNVVLTLDEDETWLKINNNQVGFYRVNYPLEMWDVLIQQLKDKSSKLTISDRVHLLNDIFALADSEHVPYRLALKLTTYLIVEEDYVPWETAGSIFSVLDDQLTNAINHQALQAFVQRLLKPLYDKQTWEKPTKPNIGALERRLRERIIQLAAKFRLPDAQTKARNLLVTWLNGYGSHKAVEIEPDLRNIVYYYGMVSATPAEWDKLWEIYLKEEDPQELVNLRKALAAPADINILRKYINLVWDEKNIRSQDYFNILTYIADNPSGTALVWDEIRTKWSQLVDRFTLNSSHLEKTMTSITKRFNTVLRIQEMEAFFRKHDFFSSVGDSVKKQAIKTVRNNIRWTKIHSAAVGSMLLNNNTI